MTKQKEQTRFPDEAIDILEKEFPKGSKKRGEAMAILAVAFNEGKEVGKNEITKIKKKKLLRCRNCKELMQWNIPHICKINTQSKHKTNKKNEKRIL